MRFESAEAAVQHLRHMTPSEATFTLELADPLTFAGHPDTVGMGMAIVLDTILGKGFMPGGFEQRDGVRIYRYTRAE